MCIMAETLHSSEFEEVIKDGQKLIVTYKPALFDMKSHKVFDINEVKEEVDSLEFHFPKETFDIIKEQGGFAHYCTTVDEEIYKLGKYALGYAIIGGVGYCLCKIYNNEPIKLTSVCINTGAYAAFGALNWLCVKSI